MRKVLGFIKVFSDDNESSMKWEIKYAEKIYLGRIPTGCFFEAILVDVNSFIPSRYNISSKEVNAPKQ